MRGQDRSYSEYLNDICDAAGKAAGFERLEDVHQNISTINIQLIFLLFE